MAGFAAEWSGFCVRAVVPVAKNPKTAGKGIPRPQSQRFKPQNAKSLRCTGLQFGALPCVEILGLDRLPPFLLLSAQARETKEPDEGEVMAAAAAAAAAAARASKLAEFARKTILGKRKKQTRRKAPQLKAPMSKGPMQDDFGFLHVSMGVTTMVWAK